MRPRWLLATFSVCLLLVLIGIPLAQSQTQSIATRGNPWENRNVIGVPVGDDDSDDESDDEFVDYSAPVGRTGQTLSYFMRDDGELRMGVPWPCERLTNNLNGTVTDHLTGQVWVQDATYFSAANWNTALSTCNDLADDGVFLTDGSVAGDWRLPNNKEMRRLIDFGNSSPALPDGHPFIVPTTGEFWTSTTGTNNTGRAWTINDGTMVNDPKTTPNRIWCVRDEVAGNLGPAPVPKTGQTIAYGPRDDGELQMGVAWPDPRFTDSMDGTVTDELTGLIWLADATRFSGLSFEDALAACDALADDGIDLTDGSLAGDWRLPNVFELGSLPDYGEKGPALPAGHPFIVNAAGNFWSSTTLETNADRAWTLGLGIGKIVGESKTGELTVWPVRGGVDEYDDEQDDECDDTGPYPHHGMEGTGTSHGDVGLQLR